jgi:hypothetical protein
MSHDDFDSSIMEIEIEDVIGPDPLTNPKVKKILDEFEQKTGWTSVKESVQQFVDLCRKNYQLRLECKPPCPLQLNRLFLGNPGRFSQVIYFDEFICSLFKIQEREKPRVLSFIQGC